MAKVYNITDKMEDGKPKIIWGEKEYEVNNSFLIILKVGELDLATEEGIKELLNLALGENHDIDILNMQSDNLKVLMTAIIAAVQGIDFDEAASRFQI